MAKRIKIRWDDHQAAASRRSNRWAATDRGWLFAEHPADPAEHHASFTECLGHYLDYGPCSPRYASEHDGATFHAVSCVARCSAWLPDAEAAKRWIESHAFVPFEWQGDVERLPDCA